MAKQHNSSGYYSQELAIASSFVLEQKIMSNNAWWIQKSRLSNNSEVSLSRKQRQTENKQRSGYYIPESLPMLNAWAALDIVLLRSERGAKAFDEVVKAWGLPGNQAFLGIAQNSPPEIQQWVQSGITTILTQPNPTFSQSSIPAILGQITEEEEKKPDFHHLLNASNEFIKAGFNSDAEWNEYLIDKTYTLKITPEKITHWLQLAITERSVFDFYKYPIEELEKYRGEITTKRTTKKIDEIMMKEPYNRTHRKIVAAAQSLNWQLKSHDKIRQDADVWYQCRIHPGTIEAYLDKLANSDNPSYPDRGNIENVIAPYDEAVGYPRNWRS